MDFLEIQKRNYAATVKRGQIDKFTSFEQFINKLNEETEELNQSWLDNQKSDFDPLELADIVLVCTAMAEHYSIDLQGLMREKTLYNEIRED